MRSRFREDVTFLSRLKRYTGPVTCGWWSGVCDASKKQRPNIRGVDMIKVIRSLGCAVLAALMMLSVQPAYAADDGKDFCWKDSYGRGVGTVPKKCARGYQRIGLLCYRNCPRGMKRFGFDCHSVCPKGFRNDGLFCRKAEYGLSLIHI